MKNVQKDSVSTETEIHPTKGPNHEARPTAPMLLACQLFKFSRNILSCASMAGKNRFKAEHESLPSAIAD